MHATSTGAEQGCAQSEEVDWAHRRTPQACELCRRKKVRCNGERPACGQCRIHKSHCRYLPRKRRQVSDKNNAPAALLPTRAKPFDGLMSSETEQPPSEAWSDNTDNSRRSNRAVNHPLSNYITPPENTNDRHHHQPSKFDSLTEIGVGAGGQEHHLQVGSYGIADDFSSCFPANELPFTPDYSPDFFDHTNYQQGEPINPTQPGDTIANDYEVEDDWDESDLADITYSLHKTIQGHDRFLGPGVVLLPATRRGQEYITYVTGSSYFTDQFNLFLNNAAPAGLDLGDTASQVYNPEFLPSKSVAHTYVTAYFRGIQSVYPILDYHQFIKRFEESYDSLLVVGDPVWCALVNTVLAIGCRASTDHSSTSLPEGDRITGLFRNAMFLYSRVTLGEATLMRVQTLVIMYLFLSFSASPHWGYMIFSSAASMAHAIGLHIEPCKTWTLSKDEIRQRNLVFWSMLDLDIGLTFRMGRPPMIRLEEVTLNSPTSLHDFCNLSLPSERAGSELSSTGSPEAYAMAHFELFLKNMDICQTLRKIYTTVWHHSGSASLDADVALLNKKLSKSVDEIRPEWKLHGVEISNNMTGLPPEILTPLLLNYSLALTARATLNFRYKIMQTTMLSEKLRYNLQLRKLHPTLMEACEASASLISILHAVHSLPGNPVACYWLFESFPVVAFHTLFQTVVAQPLAPECDRYMELMSIVVEGTVGGIFDGHPLVSQPDMTRFLTFFSRTARLAIRRAKHNDHLSLEYSASVMNRVHDNEVQPRLPVHISTSSMDAEMHPWAEMLADGTI